MRSVPLSVTSALGALLVGCAAPDTVSSPSFTADFQAAAASATNPGTHLSGANEVPANDSRAQGQAVFQLAADGASISYRVLVANIENTIMSHIHLAPAGENGDIVVWLRPTAPPPPPPVEGRFDGVYATGSFTAADLVGPLAGQPLSALLDAMRAESTYVNVHTSQFPPGEIRGQLRMNGR
jgi:hypothetical protein